MKKRKKKAAIELSFGMIFSIVLIIAFLAFGFYAIKKFISLQDTIKIESFFSDFQDDVDYMHKRSYGNQTLPYYLPNKVKAVCFGNDEFENLEISSDSIVNGKMIEHLDIAKTTKEENPLCIANLNGKVTIRLIKEFGETLVTVER